MHILYIDEHFCFCLKKMYDVYLLSEQGTLQKRLQKADLHHDLLLSV